MAGLTNVDIFGERFRCPMHQSESIQPIIAVPYISRDHTPNRVVVIYGFR
jgi:hypothetical protein